MDKELINIIIVIGTVVTGIIGFIWRLSNKYSKIEHSIIVMQNDINNNKKSIDGNINVINTHENKLDIITNNINNMSNVMVLKSDLTRLETEMLHLKDTIDDIKSTLRDSIKLNTTQYQELSQKLGLIIGQYSEIKDYVRK